MQTVQYQINNHVLSLKSTQVKYCNYICKASLSFSFYTKSVVFTLKFQINKNKQLHICLSESTLEESLNVESTEVEVTYEIVVASASLLLFAADEYVLEDLSMVVG